MVDSEREERYAQEEWNARVFKAIQDREEEVWREQTRLKPKLRTYQTLKDELSLEHYLSFSTNTAGRKIMTAFRTGTNVLRIETGRHWSPKLPVEERVCWCCGEDVEDEKHFVIHCNEYDEERRVMFDAIDRVTEGRFRLHGLVNTHPDILFKLLLGGGINYNEDQVVRCVQSFLVRAMKKRSSFLLRAFGE